MSYKLGDNTRVFINLEHLEQHPTVVPLLHEALSKLTIADLPNKFNKLAVEFDRVIGTTDCVTTTPSDEIVYAMRKGRNGLSRFVKNRVGIPTTSVALILLAAGKGNWRLVTGWIGGLSEREPDDKTIKTKEEWDIAYKHWSTKAILWNPDMIVPGSEASNWASIGRF